MKLLVNKLSKIMGGLGMVAKTGYNSHHKYAYVTEADILEHVRQELAKNNIFVFSSVLSSTKEGNLTTVLMSYTLVDGDSGEQMTVQSAGQGSDTQDKGIYKAITGANKYFLLKNFMLPTGDDPENDGVSPGAPKASKTTEPKQVPSKAASAANAGNFTKPSGFGPVKKAADAQPIPAQAAAPNTAAKPKANSGAWT